MLVRLILRIKGRWCRVGEARVPLVVFGLTRRRMRVAVGEDDQQHTLGDQRDNLPLRSPAAVFIGLVLGRP